MATMDRETAMNSMKELRRKHNDLKRVLKKDPLVSLMQNMEVMEFNRTGKASKDFTQAMMNLGVQKFMELNMEIILEDLSAEGN